MKVNEIIKKQRISLGLTMKELADKVGVTEATISRWESGDIDNMKRDKIYAVSQALHISPLVIVGLDVPLDYTPPKSPDKKDLFIEAVNSLTDDEKLQLLEYMDFLISKRSK